MQKKSVDMKPTEFDLDDLYKELPLGLTLQLVKTFEHQDMQAPMGCTASNEYFFIGCKVDFIF